jgi:hypothetical protein
MVSFLVALFGSAWNGFFGIGLIFRGLHKLRNAWEKVSKSVTLYREVEEPF